MHCPSQGGYGRKRIPVKGGGSQRRLARLKPWPTANDLGTKRQEEYRTYDNSTGTPNLEANDRTPSRAGRGDNLRSSHPIRKRYRSLKAHRYLSRADKGSDAFCGGTSSCRELSHRYCIAIIILQCGIKYTVAIKDGHRRAN